MVSGHGSHPIGDLECLKPWDSGMFIWNSYFPVEAVGQCYSYKTITGCCLINMCHSAETIDNKQTNKQKNLRQTWNRILGLKYLNLKTIILMLWAPWLKKGISCFRNRQPRGSQLSIGPGIKIRNTNPGQHGLYNKKYWMGENGVKWRSLWGRNTCHVLITIHW